MGQPGLSDSEEDFSEEEELFEGSPKTIVTNQQVSEEQTGLTLGKGTSALKFTSTPAGESHSSILSPPKSPTPCAGKS